MNIKSLEIIGFKSFYDKTKIHFHNQLCAIVGPNGCGKSNVIDAIRWILGEQNPRHLRAELMEELISNGSEVLKPLGMAEVSMVLEDIPNSQYDEIEIRRRVFRSGESEYRLNGVTCRLKDITDLFVDTGSGARAYSIIGQGSVDQLITAKPEEKRTLIEEVAGIRKYKIRRRETETRIKTTKENLSRIKDMTDEVKRQMDTLSLQAEQAEEFKKLSDEARILEYAILRYKLQRAQTKKNSVLDKKSNLDKEISNKEKDVIEVTNNLKALNEKNSVLQTLVSNIENDSNITKINLQSKQSSQDLIKSEIKNIDEFIANIQSQSQILTEEEQHAQNQLTNKQQSLEQVEADLRDHQALLSEIASKHLELKESFDLIRDEHNELRSTLFNKINEYSSHKGAALGHQKELEEMKIKRENLEDEYSENKLQRDRTAIEFSNIEKLSNEIEQNKITLINENTRRNKALEALRQDRITLVENSEELNEKYKEKASRLNALNQIQANYEWLPEGIRNYIIDNKGKGILGTLADYISVRDGFEKAAEAALGEKLKWIFVQSDTQAVSAIEALKQGSLGRGTFLKAASTPSGNKTQSASDKPHTNAIPLSQVVNLDNIYSSTLDNLLSNVFVVDSLSQASESRLKFGDGYTYVTKDGDIFYSNGAISGGAAKPGVLDRKKEIDQLQNATTELKSDIEELNTHLSQNQSEIDQLEEFIENKEKEIRSLEIKQAETKKDLANITNNLEHIDKSINKNLENLSESNDQVEQKLIFLKENNATIDRLENEKNELEDKFRSKEEEIGIIEQEEKRMELEIANKKVVCASLLEKKEGLNEDLGNLNNRIEEVKKRFQLEIQNIEDKKQQKLDLFEKDKQTVEEIATLGESLRVYEEKLTRTKSQRDELIQGIKLTHENKDNLTNQLSELRLKNNSFEIDLNTMHIEIENINDALHKSETFGDMDETDDVESKDNEEEMETIDFSNIDVGTQEPKLRAIQKKIERFGPVNLLAPEEFNKLEERYKFLNEQSEDLIHALALLGKAINKIDKESEKRFKETFEVMDKKFQEIFKRLFNGGEGKLVLTDPEDLLESGVEVMIRPKGKKYQSINLLSGGEKALSAIALIISACLIKPAPFLLLDEIDAPLDDRNTSSFINLVKEIDKDSQIIVITHNKKTMQEVNSLIGITSNQTGTSTVVSVELN